MVRRRPGWLGGTLLCLPLLLVGNYIFASRYLIRLETPRDPFAGIERRMAPISRPVAFATYRSTRDAPTAVAQQLLDAIGVTADTLPGTGDYLVPIDHVARVNPYPQPLNVVYGSTPSYLSFGYIGTDEQYHQVTHYWGESDTTPSILTRKVRGDATRYGDHFVRYTVFLSRRLKPVPSTYSIRTGEITGWSQPPTYPDVDRIDWSTYRGATYDGIEQIVFALGATVVEALVIGILWRRRAGRAVADGAELSHQAA